MNHEEIIRLGKESINYDRHLVLVGKESADNVLYHWLDGFTKGISHSSAFIRGVNHELLKAREVSND